MAESTVAGTITTHTTRTAYCFNCNDIAYQEESPSLKAFLSFIRNRGWLIYKGKWWCDSCDRARRSEGME